MKAYLITFRSITLAQRGERVLQESGIGCRVRRTPRWMEEKGCGYALELKLPAVTAALETLDLHGIPYRRAYLLTGEGTAREVTV